MSDDRLASQLEALEESAPTGGPPPRAPTTGRWPRAALAGAMAVLGVLLIAVTAVTLSGWLRDRDPSPRTTASGVASSSVRPSPSAHAEPADLSYGTQVLVNVPAVVRDSPAETGTLLGEEGPGTTLEISYDPEQTAIFGPVAADGKVWYPVWYSDASPPRVAWLGVAAASDLTPVPPDCPDEGVAVTVEVLAGLLASERRACFGADELRLTGLVVLSGLGGRVPGRWDPVWLANPTQHTYIQGDDGVWVGLHFPPELPPPELPPYATSDLARLQIVAHFNDSRASTCVIQAPDAPEAERSEATDAFCRSELVASAYTVLEPWPTPILREEWTLSPVIGDGEPDAGLHGAAEVRGKLYALGRLHAQQAGILVSEDGVNWSSTYVPPAPNDLAFNVLDIEDAGERLVALAPGGLAVGSGYFATMIYVSEDGLTWREADSMPDTRSGPHFALVKAGERLLAIGVSVWASEDGGLTWTETTAMGEFGGQAFTAATVRDLVVAVGQAGTSDLAGPPAYAWVSSDEGRTWDRHELDPHGTADSIAISPATGMVLVTVHVGDELTVWKSADGGATWTSSASLGACCAKGLTWTPDGFAIARNDWLDAGTLSLWLSADGASWTDAAIPSAIAQLDVRAMAWGPTYGLSLVEDGGSIALAPNPLR